MTKPSAYSTLPKLVQRNVRVASKRWAQSNTAKCKKIRDKYRNGLKLLVLTHYSNGTPHCALCGFSDIRALSIDHIDGSGHKHRKEILKEAKNRNFYNWLKKHDFPAGYQVLCMNCQFIKRVTNKEYNNKHRKKFVTIQQFSNPSFENKQTKKEQE